MRYAVCPRCWLRIRDPKHEEDAKDNCPRCFGRLGIEVPLYRTAGPGPRVRPLADAPPLREVRPRATSTTLGRGAVHGGAAPTGGASAPD